MSFTALIIFEGNEQTGGVEFANSWNGAAFIWTKIFDTFIPKKHEYDNWMTGDAERLWDWPKTPDKRNNEEFEAERVVLFWTFDAFVVKRENFSRFAGHLQAFANTYDGENKSHIESWARFFRNAKPEISAVGLMATSVSGSQFEEYDSENDETIYFKLDDERIWEVYDYMAKLDAGEFDKEEEANDRTDERRTDSIEASSE